LAQPVLERRNLASHRAAEPLYLNSNFQKMLLLLTQGFMPFAAKTAYFFVRLGA